MIIRFVDFETCGLTADAGVCEAAWTDLTVDGKGRWNRGPLNALMVNPGCPIPPEMSAVHHIVDADVKGALPFHEAAKIICDGPDYLAAHHAAFESMFLPAWLSSKWLCSYKGAVTLWPQCPDHKLQTLRYWLGLKVDRTIADRPHRALPDVYVGARLLRLILANMTIDELIEITAAPVVLPRFHFGKHARQPIESVPDSYLEWMIKQPDMDVDAKHTATVHMHRRNTAGKIAAAE